MESIKEDRHGIIRGVRQKGTLPIEIVKVICDLHVICLTKVIK
jgi:hypothetical protein